MAPQGTQQWQRTVVRRPDRSLPRAPTRAGDTPWRPKPSGFSELQLLKSAKSYFALQQNVLAQSVSRVCTRARIVRMDTRSATPINLI